MTPRLLVLTPRFPYPTYGGDLLRIYELCLELSRQWRITLASLCQTDREMRAALPAESPFHDVHRIWHPKWLSAANVLRAAISGECLQVAYYQSSRMARVVSQLASDTDAVLCHLLRTAPYAASLELPKTLELTDYLPLTYARSNAVAGQRLSLRRMAYMLEESRVGQAQQKLCPRFDVVSFVSEADRTLFLESVRLPAGQVVCASNGITLDARECRSARSGVRLAFIGNMASMPNQDAVSWFAASILPLITKSGRSAALKVVGPVPEKYRKGHAKTAGLSFTGAVQSIADAVSDCVIGICPVRIGAGVQNKVLEYMALGLPVVTTSTGAEGLLGTSGIHRIVADSAGEFAAAVLELLNDSTMRERMAAAGRRLVESHYSWRTQLKPLLDAMSGIMRAKAIGDGGGKFVM